MALKHFFAFVVALSTALFFSAAQADSPDRKNRLSGQEVVDIYLGKTWVWSKGGSYYGSGGQFEAIWEDAVGIGKWYATSTGKLCYEATWYNGADQTGRDRKRCWSHARDSQDRLWKEDQEDGWYRAKRDMSERIKDGNQIRSEVRKRRAAFGV